MAVAFSSPRALMVCAALTACGPRQADPPPRRLSKAESESAAPTPAEAEARAKNERKRECMVELIDDADVDARFVPLLRALCAETVNHDVPGAALAVVEGDELVLHVEVGVRCSGEDAPVARETPFRLGSVSKVVTSALILGRAPELPALTLDTRARALIPALELPPGLGDPTLAALLNHRSGLGEIDPGRVVEYDGDWRRALSARDEPGYSNANYVIAGAMLEAASERSYAELVREDLSEPLGLAQLGADPTKAEAMGAACGHLEHDRDRHPSKVSEEYAAVPGDPRWLWPTGGVFATAEELARLGQVLGGEALPEAAPMLEAGEPLPPLDRQATFPDARYSLGLRSWAMAKGRAYGHSGDTGSSHAELMFVPGVRSIAIMTNLGAPMSATTLAARTLLDEP